MDDLTRFNMEWEKFTNMLDNWDLTPEDYYKAFSDMCIHYDNTSCVPYSICNVLIDDEFPCEEYYMQMLMDVYSDYNIGEEFLELLQKLIDEGYCTEYQKKAHELIKDNIQDGFVIDIEESMQRIHIIILIINSLLVIRWIMKKQNFLQQDLRCYH